MGAGEAVTTTPPASTKSYTLILFKGTFVSILLSNEWMNVLIFQWIHHIGPVDCLFSLPWFQIWGDMFAQQMLCASSHFYSWIKQTRWPLDRARLAVSLFSVFMLSYANGKRHINSARKRINVFPKTLNYIKQNFECKMFWLKVQSSAKGKQDKDWVLPSTIGRSFLTLPIIQICL